MSIEPKSTLSRFRVTGWWLAAAVLSARLIPLATQPGMFFDGVTYATISRNMANGVGDLWHPRLAPDFPFYDSPPFAFFLESLFFRACGDHFWVEKLYSALTVVATAWLIAAIWRVLVGKQTQLRECGWLPVALWGAIPSWGMMYCSNMLENTLGIFAAASVYCSLRAAASQRFLPAWASVAGIAILGATLSKGPVGLFPLVVPLAAQLLLHGRSTWRKGALATLVCGGTLAMLFRLLILWPDASRYLSRYFDQQVVASLAGTRGTVTAHMGRFTVLSQMAHQLALPMALATGLVLLARWAASRSHARRGSGVVCLAEAARIQRRAVICFSLLLGASASLPIMMSARQWGHYSFPSYAYFALGLAAWCAPAALTISRENSGLSRPRRWFRPAAIGVAAATSFLLADWPRRDLRVARDVRSIERLLPSGATVEITPLVVDDASLVANLRRWGNIRLVESAADAEYRIEAAASATPLGYSPVAINLVLYRLYRRDDVSSVARRPEDADRRELDSALGR